MYARNSYDMIDQHGMWQMLRVYGVGGKLLKAVQSFYINSRASGKNKVFYDQEPPSGESTTTECGFNYQLLAVIY